MYYSSDHYRFWNTMWSMTKEFSYLASKILSFIVQSATCERLFSTFGNFMTKKRNRLSSKKMHFLTQVKRKVNKLIYYVCFYFTNFCYCTRLIILMIKSNWVKWKKKKKSKRLIKASEYEKIFERRNNSNDENDDNVV